MGKRRLKLSDQIRRAVDGSDLSRSRFCKDLGLAEATMSRFMSGRGGLSMETLDALADFMNLNITNGKRRSKGR